MNKLIIITVLLTLLAVVAYRLLDTTADNPTPIAAGDSGTAVDSAISITRVDPPAFYSRHLKARQPVACADGCAQQSRALLQDLEALLAADELTDLDWNLSVRELTARLEQLKLQGAEGLEAMQAIAERLFSSPRPRDVQVAVDLAVGLADPALLARLENLLNATSDGQLRAYVVDKLQRMNLTEADPLTEIIAMAGNETKPAEFNRLLQDALIRAGGSTVVDWLDQNAQGLSGVDDQQRWLSGLESTGQKHGDRSLDALIELANRSADPAIRHAAYNGVASIGTQRSHEYLFDQAVESGSADELDAISDALSRTPNETAWVEVHDQVLFGDNLNARLVALQAYAEGYYRWNKAETVNTLRKLSVSGQENGFPDELVAAATDLLNGLPAESVQSTDADSN